MRLDDLDPTNNARDHGRGGGFGGGGGGFGGGGLFSLLNFLPLILGRKMGCLAMILILGAVAIFGGLGGGGGSSVGTGGAPQRIGQSGSDAGSNAGSGSAVCSTGPRLEACRVMTLADTMWEQIFAQSGARYTPATINFFSGSVQSGCGNASSAVGPFYCPADQGIYLDTAFFDELSNRFGAQGDLARIYVVAHEVGHHIQTLLGTSQQVSREQARLGAAQANQLSVRLELQADCYAGVVVGRNRDRLEPGDIEEGMVAANAIGDDTLQRQSQGGVRPESFTHGTSEQRKAALRKGIETGDPNACTF